MNIPVAAFVLSTLAATQTQGLRFREWDGVVSMEAERATVSQDWTALPGKSGDVMRDDGGILTFEIEFTWPGRYLVWFLHQKPQGATDDRNDCHAEFDGAPLHLVGSDSRPIGMGTHQRELAWESRPKTHHAADRSRKVCVIVPSPGRHVFRIRSRSPGYLVDKVCLINELRDDALSGPAGMGFGQTSIGTRLPDGVQTRVAALAAAGYSGRALKAAIRCNAHEARLQLQGRAERLRRQIEPLLEADPCRALAYMHSLSLEYAGSGTGDVCAEAARRIAASQAYARDIHAERAFAHLERSVWQQTDRRGSAAADGIAVQLAAASRQLKRRYPESTAVDRCRRLLTQIRK